MCGLHVIYVRFIPVSYTHLDVYKRQGKTSRWVVTPGKGKGKERGFYDFPNAYRMYVGYRMDSECI